MSRDQRSRLDRLEQAAEMRGATNPQSGVLPFDDARQLDFLAGACTLEVVLAGAHCSLTLDDVLYAEALAPDTNAADDDFGNDQ